MMTLRLKAAVDHCRTKRYLPATVSWYPLDCGQVGGRYCNIHYLLSLEDLASASVRRKRLALCLLNRGVKEYFTLLTRISRSGVNYKFILTAAARVSCIPRSADYEKFGPLGGCREVSRVYSH